MARHEAEREDLMVEATALRERIELVIAGQAEPVVAGFRADGRWSVYFGSDPVYHFHAGGALHRAFWDGDLYRTQGTTLARLHRNRTADEVQLLRHDLTPTELAQFLARMLAHLAGLQQAIETDSARITRQVPENTAVKDLLLAALREAATHAIC